MLSERLRRRLEQMPLGRSPHDGREPIVPQMATQPAASIPGHEVDTIWGPHWLVQQPIEQLWPASQRHLPEVLAAIEQRALNEEPNEDSDRRRRKVRDELSALRRSFPTGQVFLDVETCGLAGAMVFLIGLVHWHDGRLVLSQLWARNYAEEQAILGSLAAWLTDQDMLITFNGKAFDWPLVCDRRTLHRLRQTEPRHIDLLHHARRRWRGSLPNCRLQTLEQFICGRRRVEDLTGYEIPQAYHHYVRTGDTRDIGGILHHNALDLVTLLQLGMVFVRG